jgi:hypothetical protein
MNASLALREAMSGSKSDAFTSGIEASQEVDSPTVKRIGGPPECARALQSSNGFQCSRHGIGRAANRIGRRRGNDRARRSGSCPMGGPSRPRIG